MESEKKFFILYSADKVVAEGIQCDILIDDKPVSDIKDVVDYINEHQFLHIVNMKGREVILNAWSIIKLRYYERQ